MTIGNYFWQYYVWQRLVNAILGERTSLVNYWPLYSENMMSDVFKYYHLSKYQLKRYIRMQCHYNLVVYQQAEPQTRRMFPQTNFTNVQNIIISQTWRRSNVVLKHYKPTRYNRNEVIDDINNKTIFPEISSMLVENQKYNREQIAVIAQW